ncbi:TonB-dependent receptor domain-containing protein [Aliikangiella sp. IMCC44359]|uniref:TonB-dependent receptor domain-containing protein n=1 Tax=Aliikangiella sp. IMCC44359 TaxID=3459125 RepID=UPI00403B3182
MLSHYTNNKLAKLPVIISAVLAGTPAFAEETIDVDPSADSELVVVVGHTTNTEITPDDLEKYQANDLEDIFRQTPAVTVGGSLGIAQKIYVRGLEDTMLNVTVDGAPQTSTLFHHIGRVSIEPELLRNVEVQAGAGEATAGSGAVGGAIRFKTKSADDLLGGDKKFGGTIKASYFTNDGHKESLSFYGKVSDNVGILASYVNVERNNMEDGDGKEIPGTAANQSLTFVKLNAELTNRQNLTVSYEHREEEGKFAKQTNWAPLQDDPLYESEGERETIVLNHVWYFNELVNLETTVYNTESSFSRELFTWIANIETTGFDIRNTSDVGSHSLTYGVERKDDEVNAYSYADFGGIYKEEGTVTGIYLQDHWQVFDDLLVSFGVRQDTYELDHTGESANWIRNSEGRWVIEVDGNGNPITSNNEFSIKKQDGVSKNLGFVYTLADNLDFSVGYAEAFRGRQVADGFTVGELAFNPNLEAEDVINKEVGLEYSDGTFVFEVSAYNSEIEGVVFDKFKGREGVFYENIGDLETKGFELVAGYQADNFDVLVSYSSNDVELNNAPFIWPDLTAPQGYSERIIDGVDLAAYEYGGLGNAGGDSWNVAFNYEINEQLEAGWNFQYVESLNDIDVFHRSIELGWVTELNTINKPSYQVHDVYVKYDPTESVSLHLTVQNLLNESYRSHGSVADYGHIPGYESIVGIKEAGRDIRLTASYQF